MTPKKPQNIPQGATWNEKNQEWELGQKNAEGKSIGKWLWWRKDGSLVCEAYYDGDTGQNFTFTRFHEDGTFSQQGTFLNGKYHDVLTCQISDNPTTEGVNTQQIHPNIFSWKMFFEQGKQIRGADFFNKNGDKISKKGILKPKNIPQEAVAVDNGTWQLSKNIKGILEKFNGITKGWNEQGNLIWEAIYDIETENVKKAIYYHTDGSTYRENDFETCIGYSQKSEKPTFQNLEEFKGDTYKITYNFLTANSKTGLISTKKNKYYDKDGNRLTKLGKPFIKPVSNAKLIELDYEYFTYIYFYDADFNDFTQKEGTLTCWKLDGNKNFEAEYKNNELQVLQSFLPTGDLDIEELFAKAPEPFYYHIDAPLNILMRKEYVKSLKVYKDNTVHEFLMDENRFCITTNFYENNNLVASFKNSDIKDDLSLTEFIEEFNKRYCGERCDSVLFNIAHLDGYFNSNFLNQPFDIEQHSEFFKVVVIGKNSTNNQLIYIQEPGEHFGKIFYNNISYSGLTSLSSIDYYFTTSELKMDKNELIKLMPFYEVAENLNELIHMISVFSSNTYYGELIDLEEAILKSNAGANQNNTPNTDNTSNKLSNINEEA